MPIIIEGKGYGQVMPGQKQVLVTVTEGICENAKNICYANMAGKPNKTALMAICNKRFEICRKLIGKKVLVQTQQGR